MKQFIYILFTLTILFTSCAERVITISEEDLPEDRFYYAEDIEPFTGICKINYKNGALKEEFHFVDGILNGQATFYYNDSTVKRTGSYNDGKLDGKWAYYNSEGKRIMEVHFDNGKMEGTFVSWYCTGVIKEKGIYTNNKRRGEWINYDEAGMITEQLYY